MDNFPTEDDATVDNFKNSQKIGVSRGGRTTKIHALVNSNCKPVSLMLSEGNKNDCTAAIDILSLTEINGQVILGDKAYGTTEIRTYIAQNGGIVCIPPKLNTREPWDFDAERYKNRNVVERFFNRLKQYRAVATRYDKLAGRYFGFVLLASIMILVK